MRREINGFAIVDLIAPCAGWMLDGPLKLEAESGALQPELASWADLPKRPSADQLPAGLSACRSQASAVGSNVMSSCVTAEFFSPLCVLSESAVLRHEQCGSPWCSPPGPTGLARGTTIRLSGFAAG